MRVIRTRMKIGAVFHGLSARCLRLYVAAGRATSVSCRAFRSSDAFSRVCHTARSVGRTTLWLGGVVLLTMKR